MARKSDKNLVVGLDVGTSNITALVGLIGPDGKIEVVGVGRHPSHGLKRAEVVNIEATVQATQRAVEEAELMAGCEIRSVFTGIAGSHVKGLNSHGIVAIRDSEVSQYDIDRVIDAAKAVAIPADQKILHILPQEFIVDERDGVRDPVGMSGVRLEAKVHMITGAVSAAQNVEKCVRHCGLQVSDMILGQIASSEAVLIDDEKELGVCLVDIGGGTSDMAIFTKGAIRHTAAIPIAGDQVTNDIAVALRTPAQAAEEIKKNHGSVLAGNATLNDMIEVPSVGGRPGRKIPRKTLVEVITARYEELFTLIRSELRRSGFEELIAGGVVLTGGATKIEGVLELAESVLRMPVRLGVPQQVVGIREVVDNAAFATSIGLLHYGHQHYLQGSEYMSGTGKGMFRRLKKWFQGNF
ncbi:MAG: cell division protein FtsA [Gammaproteobacteria bacterium]